MRRVIGGHEYTLCDRVRHDETARSGFLHLEKKSSASTSSFGTRAAGGMPSLYVTRRLSTARIHIGQRGPP